MNVTKPSSKASSSTINFSIIFVYCVMIGSVCISCSSLDDRQESLKKLGTNTFDQHLWKISDDYVRGTMIYDFLKANYPITNKSRSFIISQLGNSTGYFEYDINPAYYIGGSQKERSPDSHMIVFIIDSDTKKVSDILVNPES